jgi:hypothetical protein
MGLSSPVDLKVFFGLESADGLALLRGFSSSPKEFPEESFFLAREGEAGLSADLFTTLPEDVGFFIQKALLSGRSDKGTTI